MGKTRTIGLVLGCAMAVALTACGHKDQPTSTGTGTPTTPTAPTAPPTPPAEPPTPPAEPPTPPGPQTCTYAVAAEPDDFDREGGNGTLAITTAAGCKWTVKTDATWVAVEGPTQGEGPATLKFSAQPNEGALERRMTISIADKSVTIAQPGRGECTYQVSPINVALPRIPWTSEIMVTTTPGCRWTAVSDSPWAHLQSAGGSGPGKLTYSTDFSSEVRYAVTRTAIIAIRWDTPTAGQNVRITQWGACNVAFAAPPGGAPGFSGYPGGTVTVGPGGGETHLFVLTDPFMGCAWSVESDDSWITVNFPGLHRVSGGDGDIRFTVPPNPLSTSRQGVLMVGDRALTIIQQGR